MSNFKCWSNIETWTLFNVDVSNEFLEVLKQPKVMSLVLGHLPTFNCSGPGLSYDSISNNRWRITIKYYGEIESNYYTSKYEEEISRIFTSLNNSIINNRYNLSDELLD